MQSTSFSLRTTAAKISLKQMQDHAKTCPKPLLSIEVIVCEVGIAEMSVCHLITSCAAQEPDGFVSIQSGVRLKVCMQLKHFAEKGWRHVRPQPFYRAPNSPTGLMLGKLLT